MLVENFYQPKRKLSRSTAHEYTVFNLPGNFSWFIIFSILKTHQTMRPETPITFMSVHSIILNCAATTTSLIEAVSGQSITFNSLAFCQ